MCKETTDDIKKEMQGIISVHLTMDAWTNMASEDYITYTAQSHYSRLRTKYQSPYYSFLRRKIQCRKFD